LNANGLIRHKEELILFLKEQHIDILLISETHFTAESYIKIPNYRVYHTNHRDGTAHGGIAILIKHTTDHYQLQKYEENHLQATSIKVGTLPYELTISAVYCPPRHNIKKEQFEHFFCTLG
jgi:exonuclease III